MCGAGDEFAGTAWDVLFQGSQNAPVLEAVGTDVMTVGNHEFDYGALPSMACPLLPTDCCTMLLLHDCGFCTTTQTRCEDMLLMLPQEYAML